ncbi:DNA primase [Candidatus Dojkabacteria bacterium]|uniref:DNA primase n=1 Tax=Candidatus Dojkabacteria bacterium TaxID=2099670 RepID=A0A3M0Z003_9BACT|nr:MAG: DNA primase [Candidatus Dojkabacteria bacterium]
MESDIELIKSKINIVDLIRSYIPNVHKAGSSWRCLCPFHKEKTPSFYINERDQYYKCFGCGEKGDVFTFVEKMEKVDFKEALQILADKAGVNLSEEKIDPNIKLKISRIHEANEYAANYYNYILTKHPSGEIGRKYAQKRGLNDEIISKFKIGFAPDGYTNLKQFLNAKNFKDEELVEFGLVVKRNGKFIDKFRNRLVQPIFSLKGQVIGFSGRYIGNIKEAPKYLNSPETLVFKKNENLYSLFHSKRSILENSEVIIVEGNIDVLSSHKVGVCNIVAPLGTSFTETQAQILKRYTDKVIFCFDNDSAGIKALVRSLEIVERLGFEHKTIDLGAFKDTDELINSSQNPTQMWMDKIKNSVSTVEYLFDVFKSKVNLDSIDGKTAFKKNATEVLKVIRNDVLFFHYARILSLILEVPEKVLLDELSELRLPKNKVGKNFAPKIEINEFSTKTDKVSPKDIEEDIYFISLLINCTKRPNLEFPKEGFLNCEFFQKLLNFCVENYDSLDLTEFSETLNDEELRLFDLFISFDNLPDYTVIDNEYKIVEKRLWKRYIEKSLMRLRSTMEEDNPEHFKEVQRLTKLKKYLQN